MLQDKLTKCFKRLFRQKYRMFHSFSSATYFIMNKNVFYKITNIVSDRNVRADRDKEGATAGSGVWHNCLASIDRGGWISLCIHIISAISYPPVGFSYTPSRVRTETDAS